MITQSHMGVVAESTRWHFPKEIGFRGLDHFGDIRGKSFEIAWNQIGNATPGGQKMTVSHRRKPGGPTACEAWAQAPQKSKKIFYWGLWPLGAIQGGQKNWYSKCTQSRKLSAQMVLEQKCFQQKILLSPIFQDVETNVKFPHKATLTRHKDPTKKAFGFSGTQKRCPGR